MKILIVVNNLRVANGVATVMMNQLDSLINNNHKVDFIQFMNLDSIYYEKIIKCGGKIFTVSKDKAGLKKISNILHERKYDIIHINQMNFETVYLAYIAKKIKTRLLVYHTHNTKIPGTFKRNMLEKISNIFFRSVSNCRIACSEVAGKYAFKNKKYFILKNSINVDKFKFNSETRKTLRNYCNIDKNVFVVGTVCRIAKQKNPLFVMDVFSEILKIQPNSMFVWIGTAVKKDDPIYISLQNKINALEIKNKVLFLGSKNDVENWYSIMDAFIMPSLWEGLGITYIESQANGLPTYASDVVPRDSKITEDMHYLSLNANPYIWAKEICSNQIRDLKEYEIDKDEFINSGYDLRYSSNELLKIYNNFIR